MPHKRNRCANSILNGIKLLDLYGYPITLKYKKKAAYQTVLGGICTILVQILIGLYLAYLLTNVIYRSKTELTYSLYKRSLLQVREDIKLNKDNFYIAFQPYIDYQVMNLSPQEGKALVDNIELYLDMSLQQVQIAKTTSDNSNGNSNIANESSNVSTMMLKKCIQTVSSTGQIQNSLLNGYYCPSDINITLSDGEYADISKSAMVKIDSCDQIKLDRNYPNQGLKCKTYSEIQKILPYISFKFVVTNQYFDVEEYQQNPIKENSDVLVFTLTESVGIIANIQISQNFAILQDSIYSNLLYSQNLTYYQASQPQTRIFDISRNESRSGIFKLDITMSKEIQSIQRKAYTILDALSSAGGLLSFMIVGVKILLRSQQEIMFFKSILAELYLVADKAQAKSNSKSQTQIKLRRKKTLSNLHINDIIVDSFEESGVIANIKNPSQKDNDKSEQLSQYINSLKKLELSFCQIMKFKITKALRICRKFSGNDLIFYNGKRQFEHEIDIITVVRSLRKVQQLENILLSKYQRQLLPFMKQNVITENSQIEKTPIDYQKQVSLNSIDQHLLNNQCKKNIRIYKHLSGFQQKKEDVKLKDLYKDSTIQIGIEQVDYWDDGQNQQSYNSNQSKSHQV